MSNSPVPFSVGRRFGTLRSGNSPRSEVSLPLRRVCVTTEEQLTSPRVAQDVLAKYGLRPKKRFGQNFLVDANIVNKIAEAAGLGPQDVVLEVGPGIGTLTQELVRRAARVVAVELDPQLLPVLHETIGDRHNVQIVHGDALEVDLPGLFQKPELQAGIKVVANLPYYLTTPLIFRLVETLPLKLAVIMVQKEVADRLMAKPGGKEYGALTVSVGLHCNVEWVTQVPPTVFLPQPDVSSGVVRLVPRPTVIPPVVRQATARVVKAAFGQRRKTLRTALANQHEQLGLHVEQIDRLLELVEIDGRRRGETISVAEFVALGEALLAIRRAGSG